MSISLSLLRAFSEEYKEYKRLLARVRYFERREREGYNVERASYEYWINQDRLKELKKILREKQLIS